MGKEGSGVKDEIRDEIKGLDRRVTVLEGKQGDVDSVKEKVLKIEVGLESVTAAVKEMRVENKLMTTKMTNYIEKSNNKFTTVVLWLVGSVLISLISGLVVQGKYFSAVHEKINNLENKVIIDDVKEKYKDLMEYKIPEKK